MPALLALLLATSPVIEQIAQKLDDHPLIQIGERHRWGELHQFLRELLRDPRFVCRLDDVVVESGNSRLQPIADRYGSGGEVSEAEVLSMLRETAVPLTWNAPVYRQFLETIREVNVRRLCPRAVRIVLADAPLDWSKIRTVKDYLPWQDRDAAMAATIEREVLAKGHHAFILSGLAHAVKETTAPEDSSTAQLIERKHPGVLFSIIAVGREAAQALHLPAAPSLTLVRGSALEQADFAKVWKLEKPWPAMSKVVDALFFVGEQTDLYPPPSIYLEPRYLKELRRRAAIIQAYSGQDFPAVIDKLVNEARKH
jgi:hypothetical protein